MTKRTEKGPEPVAWRLRTSNGYAFGEWKPGIKYRADIEFLNLAQPVADLPAEPSGWLVAPFGQFRPNRAVQWTFPPSTTEWAIPLYAGAQPIADLPAPEPLTDERIEAIASKVYVELSALPGWVPWVPGGNANAQDCVRRIVRAALATQP